jgi:hypothetical protein
MQPPGSVGLSGSKPPEAVHEDCEQQERPDSRPLPESGDVEQYPTLLQYAEEQRGGTDAPHGAAATGDSDAADHSDADGFQRLLFKVRGMKMAHQAQGKQSCHARQQPFQGKDS